MIPLVIYVPWRHWMHLKIMPLGHFVWRQSADTKRWNLSCTILWEEDDRAECGTIQHNDDLSFCVYIVLQSMLSSFLCSASSSSSSSSLQTYCITAYTYICTMYILQVCRCWAPHKMHSYRFESVVDSFPLVKWR